MMARQPRPIREKGHPTPGEQTTDDRDASNIGFTRRRYLGVLGSAAAAVTVGATQAGSANEGALGNNTDSDRTTTTNGNGFSWDQTFTDTSWVSEANANDNLDVNVVSSLDFDADNGLAAAVDNTSGPTVVVFEVGGVIEVPEHDWRLRNDHPVWIAGETAPWPGITVTQCLTRIHEPKTIVSHVSFLQGDQGLDEYDSCLDIDAGDVMVDHCTVAWGTEENIGMPGDGTHRISVINTMISEPLYDTDLHDDARARGMLAGRSDHSVTDVTHLGCLYAHCNRRQPLTRADMVMCNNYVYNYSSNPHDDGKSKGNIVNFNSPAEPDITAQGLAFEPGAGTPDGWDRPIFSYDGDLYADDLAFPDSHPLTDGSQEMLDEPPLVPDGLNLEEDVVPASETPAFVTNIVGARPADRAPYEEGLINERLTEDHIVIDSQEEVGGYPDYDPTTRSHDVPEGDVLGWVLSYKEDVEASTSNSLL